MVPRHSPLSSPRKRRPIRRALSMLHRRPETEQIGIMRPRFRGDDTKRISRRLFAGVLLVITIFTANQSLAQPVVDFYRGKTIEFLVGGAAGGGYDVAARLIANHMGRHIPGNPAFIVRNVPGATGLVMTNQLYNVAKRDGTVVGMPTSNVPLEPRLKLISPDGSNMKFDLARMSWIGTPLQEPQVTWVWHTAPAKSVADLKTYEILIGATTAAPESAHSQL